jgi:hypothetical protein
MAKKYTIQIKKDGSINPENLSAAYCDRIRWKNHTDVDCVVSFPNGSPFRTDREMPVEAGGESELREVTTEAVKDFHYVVTTAKGLTAKKGDVGDPRGGTVCTNCG